MACVAVPSRITRHTDLSAADLTVASLADLDASPTSPRWSPLSDAG